MTREDLHRRAYELGFNLIPRGSNIRVQHIVEGEYYFTSQDLDGLDSYILRTTSILSNRFITLREKLESTTSGKLKRWEGNRVGTYIYGIFNHDGVQISGHESLTSLTAFIGKILGQQNSSSLEQEFFSREN